MWRMLETGNWSRELRCTYVPRQRPHARAIPEFAQLETGTAWTDCVHPGGSTGRDVSPPMGFLAVALRGFGMAVTTGDVVDACLPSARLGGALRGSLGPALGLQGCRVTPSVEGSTRACTARGT
jgi:hypothetical protein